MERPAETPTPEDPVLTFTRGKKVLIAGGIAAREDHRRSIEKTLELRSLEWEYSEKGQPSIFSRLADNVRPGKYDLVLFVSKFSSHNAERFLKNCRKNGICVVYLARGYSVMQVIEAIRKQALPRK